MSFVNFQIFFYSFLLIFPRISMFKHFCCDWVYGEPNFWRELSEIFVCKMFNVYYDPIRWDPWQLSKFRLFIVENCILFGFLVYFKKLMHTLAEHTRKRFHPLLSICWTNFIAGWAYAEQIFAHAQPSFKFWQFWHGHPNACSVEYNEFDFF
jgi:hypothetical protein